MGHRGLAAALVGRVARERAQEPGHGDPTAGRRRQAVAGPVARSEGDHAEPVRSTGDEPSDDERRALGHVRLAAVCRSEVHRRRFVEEEPRRELAVRDVLADLRDQAPCGRVPVDPANVVTGLVGAQPVQLEADAQPESSVVAGHPAADAPGQGQFQALD